MYWKRRKLLAAVVLKVDFDIQTWNTEKRLSSVPWYGMLASRCLKLLEF